MPVPSFIGKGWRTRFATFHVCINRGPLRGVSKSIRMQIAKVCQKMASRINKFW